MNLRRTLSRSQAFYLRKVASGQLVLEWNAETRRYESAGPDYYASVGGSKPRGRRIMKCGNHLQSALAELAQRGVIIDDGAGRLVPSVEAVKQFGSPPPRKSEQRVVRMSRTRAARDQV